MSQTPEKIKNMDWRINNVTWTTAPFTHPKTLVTVPEGTAVSEAALIHYGKERISITVPNATALFLDLSHLHHVEAEYWIKKCIAKKDKFNHPPETESSIFYERIMASVVFAYTSLEAFVNEQVPDDYVYESVEKNCTRKYVKDQIERSLNLETKLGDVLPQVLKVTTPKGGTLWNEFNDLKNLRDRIIHIKTKDRQQLGEDTGSVWNALLREPLPETHKIAKNLMKYFLDAKGTLPRWFEKCPF